MVVHVTIGTVHSWVLRMLLVDLEDMFNPLDVDNLLLKKRAALSSQLGHGTAGLSE